MKLSFRWSLVIIMTLMAIVPVVSLGIWSTHQAVQEEYKTVEQKHLLLANNISQALSRYAIDALAIFTRATQSIEQETLAPAMEALMRDVDVMSLEKFAHNGTKLLTIFGAEQAQHSSLTFLQDYLQLDKLNSSKFTPVIGAQSAEPRLYMIRKDAENVIWLATMHADYIKALQSAVSFGEGGHAAIVDERGRVLAHPNDSWRLESKDLSQISIVSQMMAGQSGVQTFFSPAVNADMIAAYTSVPATGWGVMIPQPMSALYKQAQDKVTLIVQLVIVAVLLSVLLAWRLSGMIQRPIKQLIMQIQQFGQEEKLAAPIHYNGMKTHEIEQLFTSFNQMAEQIQTHHNELEAKVADRTADIVKAKAQAIHQATHDGITNLPNRLAIRQQISQRLKQSETFSLLFIDLDGFKKVNDKYGHGIGDMLLTQVAHRGSAILGVEDTMARYGGDEFVVVLPSAKNLEKANQVAAKLLSSIKHHYEIEGIVVSVSACIGVTVVKEHDNSTDEVIHRADIAMYQAKHNGKDQVKIA